MNLPSEQHSTATSTSFTFSCQQCGRQLQAPRSQAGGRVQCPACQQIQTAAIPSAGVTSMAPQPTGPSPVADRPQGTSTTTTVPAVAATATKSANLSNESPLATSLKLSTLDALSSGHDTPTKRLFDRILAEVGKLYVGQDELVIGTLIALFSAGHVLIESVPGLGKTLFIRALGRVLGCPFGRIQFTADLMPSDITGAPIFDMQTQEFKFRAGPVFTQLLLADEINRSPAKTHAALLEIMQEYRVTIDGTSHVLDRPFLVLATQNPIESEGTYNLPEAQLDRFMFKLVASYPAQEEEAEILRLHSQQIDINQRLEDELESITSPEEILRITSENASVRVEEKLINYINEIVRKTREWPGFHLGASPRAGLALVQGARTLAAFHGRDYAIPDDVAQITLPALRHRVILSAESEVEGHGVDELLVELIRGVEVPRL
jgi:MoxR-like ATPase